MTSSDNPSTYPDPASVSFWPTAIRYGLIGGLIFIVYGILVNLTGFGWPSSGLFQMLLSLLIVIVLYVGLLFFAIRQHRDEDLGGYISLGRSVLVGIVVAVIAGVLSSVFNYLYTTVVDPDLLPRMIAELEEFMEDMGAPEEQIEKQIAGMTPTKQLMQNIIYAPIMGGIVSLIIGAIVKKAPPGSPGA